MSKQPQQLHMQQHGTNVEYLQGDKEKERQSAWTWARDVTLKQVIIVYNNAVQ